VYTDFPAPKNENDKLVFKKFFKESEEFGENCSRKVKCLIDYFSNYITKDKQNDNFIFLDVDCLIVDDISHIFNKDFYIAVTVYWELKDKFKTNNVSSGFVAIKNNVKSLSFLLQWEKQQEVHGRESPCRDQKSLSETITKLKTEKEYKIILLDSNKYNCHPYSGNIGYVKEWYERIRKNKPHVLHFSSGTINHQEIIDEALGVLDA
jgi:hypothetical protein